MLSSSSAITKLRRVFVVNVLLAMAWDLHTIVIPGVRREDRAHGVRRSALILASFGAATFVVRLAMRWIVRRASEHQVLTIALLIAGAIYMLFPFSHSAPTLMVLSFSLGLGLGMSQPMVMSLLHTHAPPGRMGEAAGVRMTLVQAMAVAVPLTFGALGATVGLTPVFWTVGVCLAAGRIADAQAQLSALRRTASAARRTPCGTWRPSARPPYVQYGWPPLRSK